MQKSKNAQYTAVGLQQDPGVRFNVRDTVQVPDAEAGRACDPERVPFRADHVRSASRESVTVSWRSALVFWCALFVIFGSLIVVKASQRSTVSKRITDMETDINLTVRENELLAAQVADARDPSNICDIACQKLKMSAPTEATTQRVIAPDTRPFENKTAAQTDASPHAVLDGMITGSR